MWKMTPPMAAFTMHAAAEFASILALDLTLLA